jgi:3-hydroxyacyl-CoA dehydrogenase
LGILPGWGGGTRMLQRANGSGARPPGAPSAVEEVFSCLRSATVAANAREAQSLGYLDADAPIVMAAADVLPVARRMAATLAEGYAPPSLTPVSVAGADAGVALVDALRNETATSPLSDWQMAVAQDLAEVLVGGADGDPPRAIEVTAMYALERRAVLRMVTRPETRAALEAIAG